MKLVLVRHGETEENVKQIVQGHKDGTLTTTGVEQAKKIGERLKDKHYDAIYVSDLGRTKQTAKEIIKFHPDTPVIHSKALRERCFGDLEGKHYEEGKEWREQDGKDFFEMKPPGGESFLDLQLREQEFLNKLYKKHKGQNILCITHGQTIKAIIINILGTSLENHEEYKHENCALTVIEIKDNAKHKVHRMACTRHI